MSKPSECTRGLVLALSLLPLPALCGVAATDKPAADGYQIRCWQLGRLLFEENHVALPADLARQGLKLSATDRHGRPIYLTETANATCLIRSSPEKPAEPQGFIRD